MGEHVVETATVGLRLTAVVAQGTTWEQFPGVWGQLLDEVYAFVRPRPDLAPTPGPGPAWQNVMLYKDDAPNVEVGVLVGRPFSPEGHVVLSRLPAGKVAKTIHRGDHAALDQAHEAVHRFAGRAGLELAGPRWEIYGHGDEARIPATEVYYLVR